MAGNFGDMPIHISDSSAPSAPASGLTVYSASGVLKSINSGSSIFTYGAFIRTGAAATCGTATLVGGTVTINSTAITANSQVVLTYNTPNIGGGPLGILSTGTRTPNISFVINSLVLATGAVNVTDISSVDWVIING